MDWLAYAWSLRLPELFIHSYSSSPNYGLNLKTGHWLWVKKDLAFHIDDGYLTTDFRRRFTGESRRSWRRTRNWWRWRERTKWWSPVLTVIYCFVLLNSYYAYSWARGNTITTNAILPIISGSRHGAEPDQGAADEVGRVEDGAQVQRDQLRECHQLTHRQAGRGAAVIFSKFGCKEWAVMDKRVGWILDFAIE